MNTDNLLSNPTLKFGFPVGTPDFIMETLWTEGLRDRMLFDVKPFEASLEEETLFDRNMALCSSLSSKLDVQIEENWLKINAILNS